MRTWYKLKILSSLRHLNSRLGFHQEWACLSSCGPFATQLSCFLFTMALGDFSYFALNSELLKRCLLYSASELCIRNFIKYLVCHIPLCLSKLALNLICYQSFYNFIWMRQQMKWRLFPEMCAPLVKEGGWRPLFPLTARTLLLDLPVKPLLLPGSRCCVVPGMSSVDLLLTRSDSLNTMVSVDSPPRYPYHHCGSI